MLRRVAAVGLLTASSLLFALRFAPPPTDRFYLDDVDVEIVSAYPIPVEVEDDPEPLEATRPSFAPLPSTTTTTVAPLPPGAREFDSDFVRFGRGDLQLRVRIEFDTIVDIEMLRVPHDSERARQTNIAAHPVLRAEALDLQDYRVHVVSGATETSYGWAAALRNALEKAEFCTGVECDLPMR